MQRTYDLPGEDKLDIEPATTRKDRRRVLLLDYFTIASAFCLLLLHRDHTIPLVYIFLHATRRCNVYQINKTRVAAQTLEL